ncbi:hypothetical protein DFP72DRAFT_851539 [Ephemerocybe angulata]|uniref:Uncharacterized protein n=1 Tax=Ephemerocybe angulata TaxID=980116 RepID=A0A8H6M0C7_9AGAR|nr:hypothetical protein DFP72DRAFT_851539 [Tulosesus angulatus]
MPKVTGTLPSSDDKAKGDDSDEEKGDDSDDDVMKVGAVRALCSSTRSKPWKLSSQPSCARTFYVGVTQAVATAKMRTSRQCPGGAKAECVRPGSLPSISGALVGVEPPKGDVFSGSLFPLVDAPPPSNGSRRPTNRSSRHPPPGSAGGRARATARVHMVSEGRRRERSKRGSGYLTLRPGRYSSNTDALAETTQGNSSSVCPQEPAVPDPSSQPTDGGLGSMYEDSFAFLNQFGSLYSPSFPTGSLSFPAEDSLDLASYGGHDWPAIMGRNVGNTILPLSGDAFGDGTAFDLGDDFWGGNGFGIGGDMRVGIGENFVFGSEFLQGFGNGL